MIVLQFVSVYFRRQKLVHHRCRRYPRSIESSSGRCERRHGPRDRQEGQARTSQESHARRRHTTEKNPQKKRRNLSLLRGQRWGHRQQQGENSFAFLLVQSKKVFTVLLSWVVGGYLLLG